jgi:hypothetical protein
MMEKGLPNVRGGQALDKLFLLLRKFPNPGGRDKIKFTQGIGSSS